LRVLEGIPISLASMTYNASMPVFIPECVIFIGIQATGKSTFYKTEFYSTHLRINLDMLKTRNREEKLFQTCLDIKQHCVIDNTNATIPERAKYIQVAKAAEFKIIGYYFESKVAQALSRNLKRKIGIVPDKAILATYKRLKLPKKEEGFDELFYVRLFGDNEFIVEAWNNEI
jgi:predicted kinase